MYNNYTYEYVILFLAIKTGCNIIDIMCLWTWKYHEEKKILCAINNSTDMHYKTTNMHLIDTNVEICKKCKIKFVLF